MRRLAFLHHHVSRRFLGMFVLHPNRRELPAQHFLSAGTKVRQLNRPLALHRFMGLPCRAIRSSPAAVPMVVSHRIALLEAAPFGRQQIDGPAAVCSRAQQPLLSPGFECVLCTVAGASTPGPLAILLDEEEVPFFCTNSRWKVIPCVSSW